MIDDGAPQISQAELEFEMAAKRCQEQARLASEEAQHYLALASAMRQIYNLTIRRVTKQAYAEFKG